MTRRKAYHDAQVTSDTGPFSIVPEWVVISPLSHGAVRLYALIARYADYSTGEAFPSRSTLGIKLGCSTDSVDRFVKELVEYGALQVVRRKDGLVWQSNLYILRRTQVHPQGARNDAGTGRTRATTGRGTDAARGRGTDAQLTRPIERDPIEQDVVTSDVQVVFEAWLESTQRDRRRTKLDERRRERIVWACLHYDLEDVLDAVRGWEQSAWHCGINETGRKHNDLPLLLRDAERLEYFRDCYRGGSTGRSPTLRTIDDIIKDGP